MSRYLFYFMIFMGSAFAKAQSQQTIAPLLTKEEAVETMLQNNYDIRISRNDEQIAENNTSILNSNYLPSLQGTAGANYDETDSETDFDGATDDNGDLIRNRVINDAETRQYNAAIAVNYTLFDGLGRYYNYKRLKEIYNLTQLQARATVENTTVQLMSVYLEIARQTKNLEVFQQILEISKDRRLRAQYQFDYGQVNKIEVLNALVDINTDSINVLNARQSLSNSKRDLNLLMNRELNQEFVVDTTVTLQDLLTIDSYIENLERNNVSILQATSNIEISDYDIKTDRALLLPRIGLTGSYGWNQTDNPPSAFFPATTRTSDSFRLGASLVWDIFDGGATINRIRNSKISYDSQQLSKEQIILQVKRNVWNARGDYANALAIYELQNQNVLTNRNNFERTQELFKLGQVTSIEFRQAQINLQNAYTTENIAKYNAKLAEYQLMQLAGQLLNNAL